MEYINGWNFKFGKSEEEIKDLESNEGQLK